MLYETLVRINHVYKEMRCATQIHMRIVLLVNTEHSYLYFYRDYTHTTSKVQYCGRLVGLFAHDELEDDMARESILNTWLAVPV